jgi:hypothetical protein
MKRQAIAGMLLALAFAIPLAGCASGGKVKLSAANMCAASGGTYTASTQSCSIPASTARKGSDMCTAHGGYWDPGAQTCEVGRD